MSGQIGQLPAGDLLQSDGRVGAAGDEESMATGTEEVDSIEGGGIVGRAEMEAEGHGA